MTTLIQLVFAVLFSISAIVLADAYHIAVFSMEKYLVGMFAFISVILTYILIKVNKE